MSRGYFVTGTDTGVGKTLVSSAMLLKLSGQGKTVVGMKPVASGCVSTQEGLRNEDAQSLMACSGVSVDYALVNPYAFEPAIAPHLAARQAGVTISQNTIMAAYDQLCLQADTLIVEGVGGWQVPLTESETMEDLAKQINLPVIMVVGIRLGCINHALLTYQAIQRSGLTCCAWVANQVEDDMPFVKENITSIQARLDIPCWGVIPWLDKVDVTAIAANLELPSI